MTPDGSMLRESANSLVAAAKRVSSFRWCRDENKEESTEGHRRKTIRLISRGTDRSHGRKIGKAPDLPEGGTQRLLSWWFAQTLRERTR